MIRPSWIQAFANADTPSDLDKDKLINRYYDALAFKNMADTSANFNIYAIGYLDGRVDGYEKGVKEYPSSVKTLLAFLFLFVCAGPLFAQNEEVKLDWQPAAVGAGMIVAPFTVESSQLSWGHGMELEGWSYAATDIFGRFLPKELWFMSPFLIGGVDIIYRAGEMNDKISADTAKRKLACDLLGVLGRVSVEIKF